VLIIRKIILGDAQELYELLLKTKAKTQGAVLHIENHVKLKLDAQREKSGCPRQSASGATGRLGEAWAGGC
jgi:hypothetical protein